MEIIAGTTDFLLKKETAVAIGKFDGVHIGHRRLLEEILEKKKEGLEACVFTFDPSPASLFGIGDGKELTVREEKRVLLERMGVDILVEYPLDFQSAAILPQDFVTEILFRQMSVRFVAAGEDLSFGSKGQGNASLLLRMGKEIGFQVRTIRKICVDEREVISTLVREYVTNGDMAAVERLLGIPYPIMGKLDSFGKTKTLWYLSTSAKKLLPPLGS